jgi:hypothetical protein
MKLGPREQCLEGGERQRQNEGEREGYLFVERWLGSAAAALGAPCSRHASYRARGGGVAPRPLRPVLLIYTILLRQ